MKQLDLGCGSTPRGRDGYDIYGVDIVDVGLPNVKSADLTFEPIPFEDGSFDLVTAHDFMEHIPMVVYLNKHKRNAMIELFNDIYRVLKDGGEFYMSSPIYPHASVFQDPTHVSFWTMETPHYFSGDYYGMHDHYGHTSRFELVDRQENNNHLQLTLRARKSVDGEFLLRYP